MDNEIYYICKYTPTELIEAFGFKCIPLNKEPESFETAEQIISSNVCGFGKSIIEEVRARGIKNLVLVDCCDTIKSICDVLIDKGEMNFIHMIDVLHSKEDCARERLKNELLKLAGKLSDLSGKEFDYSLFKTRFTGRLKKDEPYIGVLGARIGDKTFADIKNVFSCEVRNLTCLNNRDVSGNLGGYDAGSDDGFKKLMDEYAAMLLGQTACMRMIDRSGRKEFLQDPSLKAIIYNTVKFCDFYGFEYSKIMNEAGVPVLKIETDFSDSSKGQLLTRLAAFNETLPSGGEEMENTRMTQEYIDFLEARFGDSSVVREAPENAKYVAGIDSGSTSTEAVILRNDFNFVSKAMVNTGSKVEDSANEALQKALDEAGITKEDISAIVSTGYGRDIIDSDNEITEISCHALGARVLYPEVRTVIDIGGQDSKVISIGEDGKVENFTMNDKCAAGTGRFLDMTAMTLEIDRDEMSKMGIEYNEDLNISSTCSVFAQSEIVSLVAEGKEINDIIHGINKSVASKVMTLVNRVNGKGPYLMTGGVAKNEGLVKALEEKLSAEVRTSEISEYCGAIGAAIYALKDLADKDAEGAYSEEG